MKHAAVLFLLFGAPALAHVGGGVYPVYELTDEDTARISLHDGSVTDWTAVLGSPQLRASDFHAHPEVGEGAPYSPADLDFRVWMGWHRSTNRVYVAMERTDDVYLAYPFGRSQIAPDGWKYDGMEFMIDGDHSGGEYNSTEVVPWAGQTAQHYMVLPESGGLIGLINPVAPWAERPPLASIGGRTSGAGPATSVMEFYVTPYDRLTASSQTTSTVSRLTPNKIIGIQLSVPDFDNAPGSYHAFHTLSGQSATWRYADRFVDARLVPANGSQTDSGSGGIVVTTPAGTIHQMVPVPAGAFPMGFAGSGSRGDEGPVHAVYLDAYYVDVYEVTNLQYQAFVEATGRQPGGLQQDPRFNAPQQPVAGVFWQDARDYCQWAGLRLPTEAEWEKAARGTDGRSYPWGEGLDPTRANYGNNVGRNTIIGSYPTGVSPYGAYDMAGNVFEWVADWYEAAYYSRSPLANPTGPETGTYRVNRGGSAFADGGYVRAWFRDWPGPTTVPEWYRGFRCVRSEGAIEGLTASESAIAFGNTTTGQTASRHLRLTNGGGTILLLDVSAVAPFSVSPTALTLTAGSTQDLQVTFSPSVVGDVRGTLVLTQSDGGTARSSISLTGTGRQPPFAGTISVATPAGTAHQMVPVPAGAFLMGREKRTAELDAFYIDTYEVANAQYEAYMAATGAGPAGQTGSNENGGADQPVSGVVWSEATAYCQWAGLRLPTAAEWEKAARGTDGRTYPWGEDIDHTRANYDNVHGRSRPVGSYPTNVSPYGAYDMSGNVWEWASDWFWQGYTPPLRNPTGPLSGTQRAVHGGAFGQGPQEVTTYQTNGAGPNDRNWDFGFRCARSDAPVQGLQVSPSILAFSQTVTGQATTLSVTLSNTGSVALSLNLAAGAPFSAVPATVALAAGSTQTAVVTFAPTVAGDVRGHLVISAAGSSGGRATVVLSGTGRLPPVPDIVLSRTQLAFGEVRTGTESVQLIEVQNTGELPLHIDSIRMTGAGLSVVPSALVVPVGQRSSATVTFTPMAVGDISGQLVFVSDDPDESHQVVPVTGRGRPPHVTASMDTLLFGRVMVGQSASQVLTLTNNAGSAVSVSNVVPGDPQYSVSSRSFTLAAGSSRDISITLTPLEGRSPQSTLTILTNDTEVPALTVVLSATSGVVGGPATISVLPTSLSFGSVSFGQSKSVTLVVTNDGGSNLRVLNIVSSSGDVTVSKSSFTLAAGAEELLTVTLQPTTAGSFSETLDIPSNDPAHPVLQVPLRATVGSSGGRPSLALDAASLSFGQVAIGETSEFLLPVRNAGTATLTISNVVSDNVQVVVSPTSLSIPPQETRSLTVRYRPMPGQSLSGRLTLYSNDTAQPQIGVAWSAVEVRSPYLQVTRVTPVDGSFGVATTAELQLVFSEPLYYRRGYTALDIAVLPEPLSGPVEDDVQVRGDGRTVVIPVTLASGTVYRLVVYGATGRSGLELFDMVESSFSTGAAPPVLARVSGRVAVVSGEQATGSIYLYDARARLAGQASVALDGSFELTGIQEGSYKLYLDGTLSDGRVATGTYDTNGDGVADALTVRAGVDQTGLSITATVRTGMAPVVSSSPVTVDLDSSAGNQGLASLGSVGSGKSVVLEVYATAADGWTGSAVTVAFDSAQVSFSGVEAGDHLLQKNGGTALFLSRVNPTASTVEFGGAILGPTSSTAVSGAGLLGRFRFTTVDGFSGETALRVSLVKVQSLTGRTNVEPNLQATVRSTGSGGGTAGASDTGPLALDFNTADGDQAQRSGGSAVAGKTYVIQVYTTAAPSINGWSAKVEYDPLQVRYVSGSFVPSNLVPGLTPLVEEKSSYVNIGGAVLGGSGSGSGSGLLGTATFEVLAGFTGETELMIRQMSWKVVGSGEQMLTVLARGTITAAAAGLAGDFSGDGMVNFSDFFLFADAFGTTDPAYDLTGDGQVNFSDFFVFADAFGTEARGKLMELAHQYLGLPSAVGLELTYPNPFNASTTIRYRLDESGLVRLAIYSLAGQRVASLVDTRQEPGTHEVTWNGAAEDGRSVATGVYLVRMESRAEVQVRRITLLR